MEAEHRIILDGDKEAAARFVRFGQKCLAELRERMELPKKMGLEPLFQSQNNIPLPGGGNVFVQAIGSLSRIEVFMPVPEEVPVEEGEDQFPEIYYYVNMLFGYIVGVIWQYVDLCSVFDVKNQRVATDIPLNDGSGYAVFPCDKYLISDWFDYSLTDPTLVPPFVPVGLFGQNDCADLEDWTDGSFWGPDASCDDGDIKAHDGEQIVNCRAINGVIGSFVNTSKFRCASSSYVHPNYHPGHTWCCMIGDNCSSYLEGVVANYDQISDLNREISFSHGNEFIGNRALYDFYYEYNPRSFDLTFVHGFAGNTSVYTSSDWIINNSSYSAIRTRDWGIIEDSCTAPGGTYLHDKILVVDGTYTETGSDSNGIRNSAWHTPLGTKYIPDADNVYNYEYYEHANGVTGEYYHPDVQTISGTKHVSGVSYIALPPYPGGYRWPSGNAYEGGNCYFRSTDGDLPELTTVVHVHGFPYFFSFDTDYTPNYSVPWIPGLGSNWGWTAGEATIVEHPMEFYASMEWPTEPDEEPQDGLDRLDPRTMTRNLKLETFLSDLAMATIKSAPWGDGPIYENDTIRTNPPGTIQFWGQKIVPYPFKTKSEYL